MRTVLLSLFALALGLLVLLPGRLCAAPLFQRDDDRPLFARAGLVIPDTSVPPTSDDAVRKYSFHDEFPSPSSPRMIDIYTVDLVEDGDPVLELRYVDRELSAEGYSNIATGSQAGAVVSFAARASRDFQLEVEGYMWKEELQLVEGTPPGIPGSLMAMIAGVKYRSPWEVFGWRTVLGARTATLPAASHPFFTLDDWARFNQVHVTVGKAFRRWLRVHFQAAYSHVPQPRPFEHQFQLLYTAGLEHVLYRRGDDYFGLMAEAGYHDHGFPTYNFNGTLDSSLESTVNIGLRGRTGAAEIDVVTRRVGDEGVREFSIGLKRKF